MTPRDAARVVAVAGWAAGIALILAGWTAAWAIAAWALILVAAVTVVRHGPAIVSVVRSIALLRKLLRRTRTETALERT